MEIDLLTPLELEKFEHLFPPYLLKELPADEILLGCVNEAPLDAAGILMAHPDEGELFIDWIGDTLPCVTDYCTGEVYEAHFFVTTLGDGSYPFVEAFPDETQLNWKREVSFEQMVEKMVQHDLDLLNT